MNDPNISSEWDVDFRDVEARWYHPDWLTWNVCLLSDSVNWPKFIVYIRTQGNSVFVKTLIKASMLVNLQNRIGE